MAHEMPDWFIPKYRDEFKLRSEQKKRRLDGLAEEGGMFIGDDCHFPRFGSAETTRSSRMQELVHNQIPLDFVKVAAEPEFVNFTIWDPDKKKLNISMAGAFAGASVRAINRARDRQHVDALALAAASGVANTKGDAAETITTLGSYTEVADLELIAAAIVQLGTDEMFEGESISIIAPFKLRVQNALDPYMAKQGELKGNRPWDEVDWRSYERLPGNGAAGQGWASAGATGVDLFIHAKSAVMTVQNDDDTEINERLGSRMGDMMGRWFQSASAVVEPKGVIRIKSKLDFTLSRRALDTYETNPDMYPA